MKEVTAEADTLSPGAPCPERFARQRAMELFAGGEILRAHELGQQLPEGDTVRQQIEERLTEIRNWSWLGKPSDWIDDKSHIHQKKFSIACEYIRKLGPRSVLDVGCFTGWFLRRLRRDFGIRGVGVDIQRELMHSLGISNGLEFHFMRAEAIDRKWSKEFDVTVLFDVLEHVLDDERVVQAVSNVTKDGGWVLVNLPRKHPGYREDSFEHLRMYEEDSIHDLFGEDLTFHDCEDEHGRPTYFFAYRVTRAGRGAFGETYQPFERRTPLPPGRQ